MDAESYDKMNKLQMKDGFDLIEKLSSDKHFKNIEYILDIGCGTGNLTVCLNNISDNIEHIYAIDIDQNLIEYAKQKNSGEYNNIEYLVQDFGVEWTQIRPELRALEGKVSIIFTNYALHWIYTRKDNVTQNMFRLLSKKGRAYTKIGYLPDPSERTQSKLLKFIFNTTASIPKEEEQKEGWTESFISSGLEIIDYQYNKVGYEYKIDDFDQYWPPCFFGICEQFYGKFIINTLKLISRIIGPKPSAYLPQFKDETTGQTMCYFDGHVFLFVLQKH